MCSENELIEAVVITAVSRLSSLVLVGPVAAAFTVGTNFTIWGADYLLKNYWEEGSRYLKYCLEVVDVVNYITSGHWMLKDQGFLEVACLASEAWNEVYPLLSVVAVEKLNMEEAQTLDQRASGADVYDPSDHGVGDY